MKKQWLIINLSLMLASPCFAAFPLIPKLLLGKHQSSMQKMMFSHDGYADFSGQWSGSCDNEPEEKISLTLEQSPDFSSITINHVKIPIDAISTMTTHANFEAEKNITHIHWSTDGQQLLGSQFSYYKEGRLSQEGLQMVVGKFSWSIENEHLHYNTSFSIFRDGSLDSSVAFHCVYTKDEGNNTNSADDLSD